MDSDLLDRLKSMYADALYGVEATEIAMGHQPYTTDDAKAQREILDKTFADLKAIISRMSKLRTYEFGYKLFDRRTASVAHTYHLEVAHTYHLEVAYTAADAREQARINFEEKRASKDLLVTLQSLRTIPDDSKVTPRGTNQT